MVSLSIENGILIAKYDRDLVLDLEGSIKIVKARLDFQKGKEYPVLIYPNGLRFGSHEGRKYLGLEGVKGLKAGAFIVNTAVESILLNFFFYINKPAVPFKMFPQNKESDALLWLQQFI